MAMEDTKRDPKVRNLVLLGKTGNGKSSTGNSILGLVSPKLNKKRPAPPADKIGFNAATGPSGVTQKTQTISRIVNGYKINVIDTPGLFDTALPHKYVSQEIVNCMQEAKEGVHAFIGVVKTDRFTDEEAKAFEVLEEIFESKALDYMIIVFTNRSDVEDLDDLEEYLKKAPDSLTKILDKCSNRMVLFDNITKDESTKTQQVDNLLLLVNQVVRQNHGQPYTNELIEKLKQEEIRRKEVEKEMAEAKAKMEISKAEEIRRKIQKETQEHYEKMIRETKEKLEEATRRQENDGCCTVT